LGQSQKEKKKKKKKEKKNAIVLRIKFFCGKIIGPKSSQYEDLKIYKIGIFRQ
jgi:hypothetical protein